MRAWETFHLDEVREIIERDWQAGEDRAIAALSMGGVGELGGRHAAYRAPATRYHVPVLKWTPHNGSINDGSAGVP